MHGIIGFQCKHRYRLSIYTLKSWIDKNNSINMNAWLLGNILPKLKRINVKSELYQKPALSSCQGLNGKDMDEFILSDYKLEDGTSYNL